MLVQSQGACPEPHSATAFVVDDRSDALWSRFGSAWCTVYPCASHQSSRSCTWQSERCVFGWVGKGLRLSSASNQGLDH